MSPKSISSITFQLQEIQTLLDSYQDVIRWERTPDLKEMTILASVMHSFYNGIEAVFQIITKDFGENVESATHWHKGLLSNMAQPGLDRGAVISQTLMLKLDQYRSFRHFFRHAYSFYLEWSEMQVLVEELEETWELVREEILLFCKLA